MQSPEITLSRRKFLQISGAGLLGAFLPDLRLPAVEAMKLTQQKDSDLQTGQPERLLDANVFIESSSQYEPDVFATHTFGYWVREATTLADILPRSVRMQLLPAFSRLNFIPSRYNIAWGGRGIFYSVLSDTPNMPLAYKLWEMDRSGEFDAEWYPSDFVRDRLKSAKIDFQQMTVVRPDNPHEPVVCLREEKGTVIMDLVRPDAKSMIEDVQVAGNGIIMVRQLDDTYTFETTSMYTMNDSGLHEIPDTRTIRKFYTPSNIDGAQDTLDLAGGDMLNTFGIATGGDFVKYPYEGSGYLGISVWDRAKAAFLPAYLTNALPVYGDPLNGNDILTLNGVTLILEMDGPRRRITAIRPSAEGQSDPPPVTFDVVNPVAYERAAHEPLSVMDIPRLSASGLSNSTAAPLVTLGMDTSGGTSAPWLQFRLLPDGTIGISENKDMGLFYKPVKKFEWSPATERKVLA